jgi:methyl-accepting chemotaxis protein
VLRAVAASVALAAALGLAACGGDDEEPAATTWADGFCTSITSWTEELQSIGDAISDPASLSLDTLRDYAEDAQSATEELVDDLRGLGAPDVESGEEVREEIDQLGDELSSSLEEARESVEDVEGLTGAVEAISQVSAAFAAASTSIQDTITSLGDLDVQGDLEDAFSSSESCDELTSG